MDNITTNRDSAGNYEYGSMDGTRTVLVTKVEPNKAYGDTRSMWVAAAKWDRHLVSDPMPTKREARHEALRMLVAY